MWKGQKDGGRDRHTGSTLPNQWELTERREDEGEGCGRDRRTEGGTDGERDILSRTSGSRLREERIKVRGLGGTDGRTDGRTD